MTQGIDYTGIRTVELQIVGFQKTIEHLLELIGEEPIDRFRYPMSGLPLGRSIECDFVRYDFNVTWIDSSVKGWCREKLSTTKV